MPAATVGLARLELATSPLSGVRSNHLSYRPERQTPRGLPFGTELELTAKSRSAIQSEKHQDGISTHLYEGSTPPRSFFQRTIIGP